MAKTFVTIVGATGETGRSVTDAFLESGSFEITALARPSSVNNQKYNTLQARGVKVVGVELTGPENDLVAALSGIEVLISTLPHAAFADQIPLAKAAKKAGVKRFVPSEFALVIPPRGVHLLQDKKTEILETVQLLHLPYTIINVGWWFMAFVPSLSSGRTDYLRPSTMPKENFIPGDGEAATAMIDGRDIGRYVVRIIQDPRTLNKKVLATGLVGSVNDSYKQMEEMSGEKIEKVYLAAEELENQIRQLRDLVAQGKDDAQTSMMLYWLQYMLSSGVRQDNTPEYAKYLGYVLASDLYPDFKPTTFQEFFREVLDGKARAPYSS
ncbi:isoflavone reductase family protein [Colletotrichum sojae]|uniref:Isoflavone reductase family protein n=1 Tax=Colletotrichum sojae TaxID=2175907 RepID=A0A8H6JMP7_9PEZI|nr:isoflavone reductase family protein [Colletotrichum sojae]